MKKIICLLLSVFLVQGLAGCASGTETDYPAAIMAEGTVYLKTVEVLSGGIAEDAILGYTTSYTDTFPKKDGETNFSRTLHMPYAQVEGGIAVLWEDEWYLCIPWERNMK